MSKEFLFYRDRLSPREQAAYDTICHKLQFREFQISIGNFAVDRLRSVIDAVLQDMAQLYNVVEFSYTYYEGNLDVQVFPKYLMSFNEQRKADERIECAVDEYVRQAQRESDYLSVLALHDAFCRNIVYNKDNEDFAHTVLGCLLKNEGVCDGISKAFKLCCDRLNIDCIVVFGTAKSNYDETEWDKHAWNKVKIDGTWYNVDITFDLTLGDKDFVRHDYFLVADNELCQTHRADEKTVPCAEPGNYYLRNMLLMRNLRDLKALLVKKCALGDSFRCEVKFAALQKDDMENKVQEAIRAALEPLDIRYRLTFSVNKEMLTACINVTLTS